MNSPKCRALIAAIVAATAIIPSATSANGAVPAIAAAASQQGVTGSVSPTVAGLDPAPAPPVSTETLVSDDFSGDAQSGYISAAANATNPIWYGEGGSDPVNRLAGVGKKSGKTRFFRMWTQEAVGGPGTSIRIKAKVRTDSIHVRDPGGVVEGTKMWLKWADTRAKAYPGPASVRGLLDGRSPGSYIYSFHTHNGQNEVMKRAAGRGTSSAYTFFEKVNKPYQPGTWEDVEMTFEWLPDALRIRSYRDGVLQMEAMDTSSNRMMVPGHAGIRSDDSTFQIDDFTVESF